MSAGFERRGKSNVAAPPPTNSGGPPAITTAATLTQAEARSAGYTGSICDICGSTRMRVAGHCMVCEECGSTTGCS